MRLFSKAHAQREINYFKLEMVLVALGTVVTVAWFAVVMTMNVEGTQQVAAPAVTPSVQFADVPARVKIIS